jgi:hypothetical protein
MSKSHEVPKAATLNTFGVVGGRGNFGNPHVKTTLAFEAICSSGVFVIPYRSTQWLRLVEVYMNSHHHENLSLPNLQYCRHHHQWHTVLVLLQRLEVDCSDSCGKPRAGSNVGWEDSPNHSMQMSPALCQRRKCGSHELASSLAEEPKCLFAFWSLKRNLQGTNACIWQSPSSTLFVIWVVRLSFVLFCVLFVCKCVLPPGDIPIAINKYYYYRSANIPRFMETDVSWSSS